MSTEKASTHRSGMAIRTDIKPIDLVTPKNRAKLIPAVWSELETPLVLVNADFLADGKQTNGFLMVTFGAIYVFKPQQFKPPAVRYKFHILEIRRILAARDSIEIQAETHHLLLTVKQTREIVYVLQSVIAELTWALDLPGGAIPEFVKSADITLDPVAPLRQRPLDALTKRALLFAHDITLIYI
jgi:hypothetical protein